jgi:lipoprotein-anchoring transpeptidase ErfK/SrfK
MRPVIVVASVAMFVRPVHQARAAITPDTSSRFDSISALTVNAEPSIDALAASEGPAILRAQILLDRARFSPGVLNGRVTENMTRALYFFQKTNGLKPTGRLDSATYRRLVTRGGRGDAVVRMRLTQRDVRGPYKWVPISVYDQEDLSCLCYASALEMLDERYHTVTAVLQKLNPTVQFGALTVGLELWVPNVEPFDISAPRSQILPKPIAKIRVAKSGRYLHALAADGSILFHFPTTVGSAYDPSPSGIYRVSSVQWKPVFRYNPALYSDVPDSRPTAMLRPGPNSPVGIVWIATSRQHLGIHGTPLPHTIGIASSHGCVRLTNWDAARLAGAVRSGTIIEVKS